MAGRTGGGITFGKVSVWSNSETLKDMTATLKEILENIGYPSDNMQPPGADDEDDVEELGLDDETPEIEREGTPPVAEEDEESLDEVVPKKSLPWQRGREDA